jgi:hypothetical protein
MRGVAIAIWLTAAGCRQLIGIDDPTVGTIDAAIDAIDGRPIDSPEIVIDAGPMCVGVDPFKVCMASAPTPQSIVNATINTGTSTLCAGLDVAWTTPQQPDACFIVGSSLSVAGLRASGPRPLVLVATGTLTVTGLIDVASHRTAPAMVGAGSPWTGCGAFPVTPGNAVLGGAGGGAGASFGAVGGNGGNGGAASGGVTMPATTTMYLRAGCAGQRGGNGQGTGASGGAGGGAVYLAAGAMISISGAGAINASGMGGDLTTTGSGGGGGGSGGMVVLWAGQSIQHLSGVIIANGGGGSGGSQGGNGGLGGDPNPGSVMHAAGGPSTGAGGDGGNGGAITAVAGPGESTGALMSGGGGGGGGVGYIQTSHALGMVSPAPAIVP